jgi:II/X family phage/plasmid replication protein
MAYDTIRLRSPYLDRQLVDRIQQQCFKRSGEDMATGEIMYELFAGELLGSWDARISVVPKFEEWITNANNHPVLRPCEPYILIEASVHKILYGHNVYGGPKDFRAACLEFVCLVEKLLDVELPPVGTWGVLRVDVAEVFRLPKAACKEYFEGIQLSAFPRRKKGAIKFDSAVYFPGKTTTVKIYHKGNEFKAHERARLRGFFTNLAGHLFGKCNLENSRWVERKLTALQRLADSRIRAEIEIHLPKLNYDFEKNPLVDEVTDAYLEGVFDTEMERLLREGKCKMDTIRDSKSVMRRLIDLHGEIAGMHLYGFWSMLSQHGDDVIRQKCSKPTFYRNRKKLEDAGCAWTGTDIVIVSNDGLVPADFAPVRSDKRLCFLPARNREEYQVSREFMRLAA